MLRSIGFAAWYRPAITGLWGAHIHAVLIDHGKLSPVRGGPGGVVPRRPRRAEGQPGRHVLATEPDPGLRLPAAPTGRQTRSPEPTPKPKPTSARGPAGTAYPPKRELDGVDTSHHQGGRIDLKAARPTGLQWWYVKATEGTTFVDPTYAERVRQARKAGLPVGAYHFARPDRGDAVDEARFFLATGRHPGRRHAPDARPRVERGALSPSELTAWTGAWVRTVTGTSPARGLVGRPIIYTPFNLEKGFGCLLLGRPLQQRLPGAGRPAAVAAGGDLAALQRPVRAGQERSRASGRWTSTRCTRTSPWRRCKCDLRPDPPVLPVLPATGSTKPRSGGIQLARSDLNSAATSIDRALDRLPER